MPLIVLLALAFGNPTPNECQLGLIRDWSSSVGQKIPSEFIQDQMRVVDQRTAVVVKQLQNEKHVAGATLSKETETLKIDGAARPDLLPAHNILHGLVSMLTIPTMKSRFVHDLSQRGMNESEIEKLLVLCGPSVDEKIIELRDSLQTREIPSPNAFKDTALDVWVENLNRIGVNPKDHQAVSQAIQRVAYTAAEAWWAVDFLNEFSPQARRILLSYAYEKCSKMTVYLVPIKDLPYHVGYEIACVLEGNDEN